MNRAETAKVIGVVMASYPTHYKGFSPETINNLVNAWSLILCEYSYERVNKGLMRYLKSDKAGFPPSPGQIIDKMPSVYEDYFKELAEIENDNIKRLRG